MKTYNFFLLLTIAVALSGCAKSDSGTDTQENELLFTSEIEEDENDEVTIVSSPDGLVCFYSRNNSVGGAAYGWSLIYDVKDGNKVYTYEGLPDWEGEGASISRIFCLPHPKRHLYLFDAFTRISGSYGYQSFIAYELKGHELKRVPILVNDQGEKVNEIGFEYNFGDYYFRFARALTYDYQYMWDEETGVFYFPLLIYGSYLLNDKFVAYQWDGSCLKPTTDTIGNPHLFAPLRNYAACLQHTKAGYVQARVDSMPDDRLRYTAWDRNQDISEEPNIVLYGRRVGNEFHFNNPPTYTYVVTIEDVPEIRLYHSTVPGQLGELNGTYKDD